MLKHKFDAIQLSDTNFKEKFFAACPLSFKKQLLKQKIYYLQILW